MIEAIVLDSTPLGLLAYRRGFKPADECCAWITNHIARGVKVYVPAIVVYELRRELFRIQNTESLGRLDSFISLEAGRYIPLGDAHLQQAARMWADVRRGGKPTADPHALDIDVILAAQSLSLGIPNSDFVVATSNVAHLAQLVPAQPWQQI